MASTRFASIADYHAALDPESRAICEALQGIIDTSLPDAQSRIWHAHPVWFIADNPVVGYSRLKSCVRLLFWSGQSFATPGLAPEGTFKAAEKRYVTAAQVDEAPLRLWLAEARDVQWDYGNLIRRKGRLERLG
jgi:hypothetical protein